MTKLLAPWTDEQVNALNHWQELGCVHPFTCPNDKHHDVSLVAKHDGWWCPLCDYRQDWAHDFMTHDPQEPSWPKPPFPGARGKFSG